MLSETQAIFFFQFSPQFVLNQVQSIQKASIWKNQFSSICIKLLLISLSEFFNCTQKVATASISLFCSIFFFPTSILLEHLVLPTKFLQIQNKDLITYQQIFMNPYPLQEYPAYLYPYEDYFYPQYQYPPQSYDEYPDYHYNPYLYYPPPPAYYPPYQMWENLSQFNNLSHKENSEDDDSTKKSTEKGKRGKRKVRLPEEDITRPKKNVQSNVSNQVFSFITSKSKSYQALYKLLRGQQLKISIFYRYIEEFVKTKKKYLSRKFLGDLCILTGGRQQYENMKKLNKGHILSIEEFRQAVAFLIFYFLRNKSVTSIITSPKLCPRLRKQHLFRKRQVLAFMEEYVRPEFK